MSFDLEKYREMFLEEAEELFTDIENILLEAEQAHTLEAEELNALFRAMHTIKGGAGSVELEQLQSFTHEVESFLDEIRNDQIGYHASMADLFMSANDAMQEILETEVDEPLTREHYEGLTAPLLEQIKAYKKGGEAVVEQQENYGFFENDSQPLKEEKNHESFGFFDASEESSEEEAFGFFKQCEGEYGFYNNDSKPKGSGDGEAFGFFDDPKMEEAFEQSEPFGFFAEALDEQRLNSAEGEAFGFFDEPDIPEKKKNQEQKSPSSKGLSAPKPKSSGSKSKKPKSKKNSSIRVDLGRVDRLMNNIGELVISSSMLYPVAHSLEEQKLKEQMLERLNKIENDIRELQESVLAVRMVPMEDIYAKFPKLIRDVSKKLGKKVEFKTTGGSVEIDKAMTEGIIDPLMHIVRNSMDHGLETMQERQSAGKPEVGTVRMQAEQGNGQIIISISDDGAGVNVEKVTQKAIDNGVISVEEAEDMTNDQKAALIFEAGLSTAEEVSDLSGRGVGMDVVKSNINKLGGVVNIHTEPGMGTTINIVLPLTLAIMDGLNVAVGQTRFILPLASIVESLQPTKQMLKVVGDGSEDLLMLRDEFIPIVRLHKIFNVAPSHEKLLEGMLIVVKAGDSKIALFVDEFLNQQQVVIKPLDKNYKNIKGVSGATVREDGSIGLILDIIGIVDQYKLDKEVA